MQTAKGKVVYLNSGDWIEHLTALEYHNNDWHIYQHEIDQATRQEKASVQPAVNVVSEEIHFYINSLAV